jgi:phosphate transport system substrate-binding protein
VFDHRWLLALALVAALATALSACGTGSSGADLRARIRIDGSSAIAPLSRALALQFERRNPGVEITVDRSGDERGFERLCSGAADISGASRAIRPAEAEACEAEGIGFSEAAVANQAIVVLVNPRNPQTCIRVEQLAQMWRPEQPIARWTQVVNGLSTFPKQIRRFGPARSSATFDFFTEAINGAAGRQTEDYVDAGKDETRTTARVAEAEGGIGYVEFSSFSPSVKGVRAEEVESEQSGNCVRPDELSVQDGSYSPLSRELLIYPSAEALDDPATSAFVDFYLEHAGETTASVGLVPLSEVQLERSERGLRQ